MKIYIYITLLFTISIVTASNAANHKHASNNSCWYETNYGKKSTGDNWAYYFCGPAYEKCDGKKHKGHDKLVLQYHGDSFTFKTSPRETYFCCDGTKDVSGHYVRANKWIVDTKTEKIQVAGGTCNKLIETDACGEEHITECTTPDTCESGMILRNKECVTRCEGDEVFESTTSNKCIKCETNIRQGPSPDHTRCIKCDTATEFFDRETKTCIKKNSENIQQYSKDAMAECWQCPSTLYKLCVKTVTLVDKLDKTGDARIKEINSIAKFSNNDIDIITSCHLK